MSRVLQFPVGRQLVACDFTPHSDLRPGRSSVRIAEWPGRVISVGPAVVQGARSACSVLIVGEFEL